MKEEAGFLDPAAGFQNVTTPEYTLDNVEYREGTYKYTRKYPGVPAVNEITMSKGVARRQSRFFDWVRTAIEGGNYRTDLFIWHFHRSDPNQTIFAGTPSRIYRIYEAFPIRVKPAADLDSMSSDVSLEDIDLSFEEFDVEQVGDLPTFSVSIGS